MRSIIEPDDRSNFVPQHKGPNVLPNIYFFTRLVRLASKSNLIAIKDLTFGFTASYAQLLTDVLNLRNVLRETLDAAVLERIDCEDEVLVNLLGPGGYEFVVGFLALVALGAVVVPISPDIPVKEAVYYATKSRAVAVVAAAKCADKAKELQREMADRASSGYALVRIAEHVMRPCLPVSEIIICSGPYEDLNKSALVIFTSGTTGPPKGAVRRLGFLVDVAIGFSDHYQVEQGDSVLHVLPVHHVTGITATLLPFLWRGGCIEFRSGGFDPQWTWERFRRRGLTHFSGVPTIYMRLMQYYEQRLLKLSTERQGEYVRGATEVKAMMCGTSALPRPLQQKWTRLRDGKPILTRFGGTEFGNVFSVSPWSTNVPDASVGVKFSGADVKLSEGDEGEVLVRSQALFSKYLFDPEATRMSLNSDGFFKTGDIARREGDFYFILGRASVDIIKSGGYKISALDIEREILGLDYISEVMVVGVEDEEFGQRVAAAVVLQPEVKDNVNLERLRSDMRSSLAGYKIPTLMRLVKELRKSPTGKVVKKVLGPEIFPPEGHPDVEKWTSSGRMSKL